VLEHINWTDFALTMLVLVIAITIHEFAHAITADCLGDPTPRSQGRISISPLDHLEPLGTVMMVITSIAGIGVGWGRPVQYNPSNLRHARWDPLKIAIMGPISNILQALVFAAAIRFVDRPNGPDINDLAHRFLEIGVWVNIALALFNFIPIPPLDGSKVLSSILPISQAQWYDQFMGRWGMWFFMALILTPGISLILSEPLNKIYSFLVGY
jgi:Zn-dependent protease